MIVNEIALKRRAAVLSLLVILVLSGLYAYRTLPRESFPDITIPYIFVTTEYEGVAPADMEKLITMPIERKLKGISDVEEIRSTSEEGLSTIAIKFLPGVDIDDALQKVRDKVDQAEADLPSDLPDDPAIQEVNFSDIPVIRVVLSGPFSLRRLKSFADDLKDRIDGVPGVLNTIITGGLEREIHVEFDLDRVAAYNVPFSTLIAAVERGNVNMPGGSVDIGPKKYLVRVPEDFKHPDEIFSLVAFVRNGKPVYLRDLAEIKDLYKDPITRTRINGQPSVTLAVQKRSGENIIAVAKGVKAAVSDMRPLLPPSLKIDLTSDMSKDVDLMVNDLENNILSGLILVLAVIVLFIGGRSAVFVSLAIPYSMLMTFLFLLLGNVTLNMVVLFSLILALGMLVDNAIVIVENIYRQMQEGKPRERAALDGTNEVAWPVITSTVTTLAAFVPMLFWPGIMGEFMKFLPITLILSLSSSLFVALVINPVLSARYQSVKPASPAVKGSLPPVKRFYLAVLRWSLRHRAVVVLSAFLLLLGSGGCFFLLGKGVEFFPETDPRRAYVFLKAPEGTNLDASDALVRQVETVVMEYPDIQYVIANVGSVGGDPFSQGGTGTHINRVALDFKDFADRSRPSPGIVAEIRRRLLEGIHGAEVQVEKEEEGPPTGPPVNMEISGDDILVLGGLAARVRERIEDIPGLVDLKDNFIRGKPEIVVQIDKEKAALLGLDTFTIAYTVKAAINGVKAGVFREGKEEYDIVARLPEQDRRSIESIRRLTVSGPGGEAIPLTTVAHVRFDSGVGAIMRLDHKRVVTVSGNTSGRLANDVIRDIASRLKGFDWPRNYTLRFTGEQKEQEKASAFLSKAFMAALFLIFFVLTLQFDSFSTPLIILATVFLSLIGVFTGLLVTGTAFGVIMTGVGVISLAGVVVNNSIVLIDYFRQLRERGLPLEDALVQAGLTRFRPVMLTAITTILGLLPMATGVSFDFRNLCLCIGGESSQWWGPMAVAVIFGLAFATLLTLNVVPVLLSLLEKRDGAPGPRERGKTLFQRAAAVLRRAK
ncbi:MAG TPA: efflux RND transporter permease subunit [Syntrophales bacterium]|nr:efflux RND transporter permease subunit [Syntrophales bacterium]HQN77444.1 efflux RND transporter permease subunit [Syntrophales bacterium]HQQ27666.1 efflux RND transporter permease subunit [Syntrophales bacterium]